jgi:hypothetical protein
MSGTFKNALTTMNVQFMRCTACHQNPKLRGWLLTGESVPVPGLRVERRDWFAPRGWAGSCASPVTRPLLILSANPGHPLPAEAARWAGFPSAVASAARLSPGQAEEQLDFVASLYRQRAPGRTSFHTRSVQIARVLVWLMQRAVMRNSAKLDVHKPWFENVWFSDVVKCSTAKELGSPGLSSLAHACRPLLARELEVLEPALVVTLGRTAATALVASGISLEGKIECPHPSGREWRRINAPEHDSWLERASRVLGLDWARERPHAATFREALAKNAWCDEG